MKTTILSLLIFFTMCGLAQNTKPHITKKIYTNKSNYTYGEIVVITIRAINTSSTQDTLIFGNLCEAYPYVDNNDYLMTFSLGCYPAISVRIILANDSIQWQYEYPHSSKPDKKLSVGQHSLFAYFQYGNANSDTIGILVKDGTNSIAKEPEQISFLLKQNYPNPFNPSTTISYSLAKQSFVSIVIYDLLGREIETIVKSEIGNGSHSVEWIPNNISSGVYYYRIITDNYSETKKLILAK